MSSYITHITLNTGDSRRIQASEVSGETLARVGPWLAALIEQGKPMPLPVSDLADYTALALVDRGALVVTLYGPTQMEGPLAGERPPLLTLGVAHRSRHEHLWDTLIRHAGTSTAPGFTRPRAPWCAVHLYPSIALQTDALEWLGDLERCIAVAWCRQSSLNTPV